MFTQVWFRNVLMKSEHLNTVFFCHIICLNRVQSAVYVYIVNDTALFHYTVKLSTTSTPPIASSGPWRLTESFEWPCLLCLCLCGLYTLTLTHRFACVYKDLYVSVCLTCWLMFSTDALCKVHIAQQTGYAPGGVNPNSSDPFWVFYTLIQSDGIILLTWLKLQ